MYLDVCRSVWGRDRVSRRGPHRCYANATRKMRTATATYRYRADRQSNSWDVDGLFNEEQSFNRDWPAKIIRPVDFRTRETEPMLSRNNRAFCSPILFLLLCSVYVAGPVITSTDTDFWYTALFLILLLLLLLFLRSSSIFIFNTTRISFCLCQPPKTFCVKKLKLTNYCCCCCQSGEMVDETLM